MKGYKSYKDSGIECIGKVPSEWNVRKLKYLAKIKNGKDQKGVLIEEGGYPVLGTGGEFGRSSTFLYNKPSVLLGRKGTIDKPFYIEEPFWTVDTLFYTEIYENTLPKFLFYLTKTIRFEFYQESSAVPSMTQDNLNNIHLCHPSLEEQKQIIAFLDYKTNLIDTSIDKKKRLIELLKEKRQAIINEAVTKGLSPITPMKDSGVDWLEEIPKNWNISKIKFLSSVISKGTTPSTEGRGLADEGVRYLKAENIKETQVSYFPEFFIDDETHEVLKRSQLEENDILFVIAGATIGKVAILPKEMTPANTNQAVCFIRLKQNENHKFLYFWLQSSKIYEQIWLNAVQSAQPNLSMEELGNFIVPYPSLVEQTEIVNFIEISTSKIDDLIDKNKLQVEKLQTYRQSLISEAVTGKIDVRNWQPTKN